MIQSYWYKHQGGTRDKYRYNQFLFVENEHRFVKRNDQWMQAPVTGNNYHEEPIFEILSEKVDPILEMVKDQEKQKFLLSQVKDFDAFSASMDQ
jgi:hypothetical protein